MRVLLFGVGSVMALGQWLLGPIGLGIGFVLGMGLAIWWWVWGSPQALQRRANEATIRRR